MRNYDFRATLLRNTCPKFSFETALKAVASTTSCTFAYITASFIP
jgi:hypothetical protein